MTTKGYATSTFTEALQRKAFVLYEQLLLLLLFQFGFALPAFMKAI
jgi:hypothetical protein